MPLQVIANSTLFKKDINGKTIVYHCLMAIQDPAHRIRDATFTFYIWNWNNDAASKLDSEIHEINTLCGGGRTRPDHIIRIEKDHGFYTTPDYEPLRNVSLSFKFNGWHGVNRDSFSAAMDELDDDITFTVLDQITDYITAGKVAIVEALRRSN
jgi:hypothetical protein